MNNGQKPAFPFETFSVLNKEVKVRYDGLSKREYFAGLAMQGMLANHKYYELGLSGRLTDRQQLAETCVRISDAILTELSKPQL